MDAKPTTKQRWLAAGFAALTLTAVAACGSEDDVTIAGSPAPVAHVPSAVVVSADALENRAMNNRASSGSAVEVSADALENRAANRAKDARPPVSISADAAENRAHYGSSSDTEGGHTRELGWQD